MYTNLARAMVKISLAAVILLNASVAAGQVLFQDDFETASPDELSKWVGKGGGAHNGVVVPDPLINRTHRANYLYSHFSSSMWLIDI